MQKIVPHLWFDKEAVEAADFYTSIFDKSTVKNVTQIHNTPSGDCDIVTFELFEHGFMAISAGPYFKFNPSISFIVSCETREEVDRYWQKLSEGGKVLMPLESYPFSERYGWVQDKYGLSWQLILTKPEGEERPKIMPFLLFTEEMSDKAKEAVDFYLSIFRNSRLGNRIYFGPDQEPNKEGTVMFSDFKIEDCWIAAMDGGDVHQFKFNEAVSLIVRCDTQEEIDYYWEKLSADPKSEQCGWLKDKYGGSWQVVPTIMDELMGSGDQEKIDRVTEAFLKMKKFNIAELKKAYGGDEL